MLSVGKAASLLFWSISIFFIDFLIDILEARNIFLRNIAIKTIFFSPHIDHVASSQIGEEEVIH